MGRRAVLLTLSIALFSLAPAAQQAAPPPPQQPSLTFRAAANYVEVDAIVTNAAGDPSRDLTAADFEVSEDGRLQPLSVCAFIDLPVLRADPVRLPPGAGAPARTVQPDVVSNEKAFDGRVLVIVLDGFHVAPLRGLAVKRQAAKFVDEYMGSNDVAAVVNIGSPVLGQEFTSNKDLLRTAVQRFVGQALPSATVNIAADAMRKDSTVDKTPGSHLNDPGPPEDTDAGMREYMARESLGAMLQVAKNLGALNGRRKALLLFSEGSGLDMMKIDDTNVRATGAFRPLNTDNQSIRLAEQDMISAAAKSNVSIYSIDPRGLTTGQEDAAQLGVSPDSQVPIRDRMDMGPRGVVTNGLRDYANPLAHADAADESRRAQEELRRYADQTGGLAMVDRNDMDEVFRRIVADNSSYYVLGYSSPDPKHDGRYHRVSVKVKRPGLHVRTQHGYTAPDDKAAPKTPVDPVVGMLASPVPVGGLGMRASAHVIGGKSAKSTVHLTVEFNGRDVALKPGGDRFTNDIDVEYLALDLKGVRQAGGREVAHLKLKPATKDAFPQNGVRYVAEFELGPGRYQLRVAAQEHLGGKTGSVFCDVDVPDFAAHPLTMSDLLLTSSSATRTPTPVSTLKVAALLPAPTTTVREFPATDTLTVAASMYDNDTAVAHRVDFTAKVRSEAGAEVFTREDYRDSAVVATAAGGFNWVVGVPLTGLAPGRYVLTVEARSTLTGTAPVRRETAFTVR